MANSTLIKNVNIVNEGKIFKGDVRIKQEKILWLKKSFFKLKKKKFLIQE